MTNFLKTRKNIVLKPWTIVSISLLLTLLISLLISTIVPAHLFISEITNEDLKYYSGAADAIYNGNVKELDEYYQWLDFSIKPDENIVKIKTSNNYFLVFDYSKDSLEVTDTRDNTIFAIKMLIFTFSTIVLSNIIPVILREKFLN